MENRVAEEKQTLPEKIVAAPVEVGRVVVSGAETVGHDLAKGATDAATVIVDGTKTVVRVIIESGGALGRDAQQVVSPAPEPAKVATPIAPLASVA